MHFLRLGLQDQEKIQSIGRGFKLAQSGDLDYWISEELCKD